METVRGLASGYTERENKVMRLYKSKRARRRKPGTLALAKSYRKRVPLPSRPFKDKKPADRRSWRKEI